MAKESVDMGYIAGVDLGGKKSRMQLNTLSLRYSLDIQSVIKLIYKYGTKRKRSLLEILIGDFQATVVS